MAFRVLLLLLVALPSYSAEISGIKIEDKDKIGNSELVLNGGGLRKRAFFSVYVIGLYLPEKKTAAADAIGAPGAKRVLIHMLRDVDAAQFVDALKDGMKDNLSEAEMKRLEPQISELSGTMGQIKTAKTGMRITLDWLPGKGTQVVVEGKPAGAAIQGEDFYRGLLRIWLGESPVQADLKKALLGG
jgi:hypothetical protein